eukprot:TRINITY_DN54130_c0_g1_i1.p1 TRINITY_DN54130_c0_g1~~TRINITY_DN54130_c0_g1_i1.p1  ORF type:complete len:240 (+),score=11.42 TRINITY_DN54130_c0_g1_i1:69-722(+)
MDFKQWDPQTCRQSRYARSLVLSARRVAIQFEELLHCANMLVELKWNFNFRWVDPRVAPACRVRLPTSTYGDGPLFYMVFAALDQLSSNLPRNLAPQPTALTTDGMHWDRRTLGGRFMQAHLYAKYHVAKFGYTPVHGVPPQQRLTPLYHSVDLFSEAVYRNAYTLLHPFHSDPARTVAHGKELARKIHAWVRGPQVHVRRPAPRDDWLRKIELCLN